MSSLKATLGVLAAGLMLSGCIRGATYGLTNTNSTNWQLTRIAGEGFLCEDFGAGSFRRTIVDYHRKEAGSIVVDSDNYYLYLVQKDDQGDPIRHHRRRRSHGMVRRTKIGSKTEWPPWHPTKGEIERLGVPQQWRPDQRIIRGLARALSLLSAARTRCSGYTALTAGIYRRVDFLGLHPHDQ